MSDVLFTGTQRQVLGLLFGNPDRSYYLYEIVRFAGVGIGTVQREVAPSPPSKTPMTTLPLSTQVPSL